NIPEDLLDVKEGSKDVDIKSRDLSSWSLSDGVALQFAEQLEFGYILDAKVPAKQILSLGGLTGFGGAPVYEVIILGTPKAKAKAMTVEYAT
ncbi:MAG: hypothetical protein AABY07_05200, partial [Nanoarchaeota archaeon]